MSLEEALKMVKLAGYRVTKPKPKKQWRVGPTCVAQFADGTVTRMTTHCGDENLDWNRGMKLCSWAYESRFPDKFVPKMISVHFERNGEILGAPLVTAA